MRTVFLAVSLVCATALFAAGPGVDVIPLDHERASAPVVEDSCHVDSVDSTTPPLGNAHALFEDNAHHKDDAGARRRAKAKRFFKGALTVIAIAGVAYLLHEELLDGGWIDFIPSPSPTPATRGDLLVYGGEDHDVFLGCLSCPEDDELSIWNEYGSFGSRYSSTSVLNPASEYGSRISARSACNALALDPPLVVDRRGHVYGRLTLNPAQSPYEDEEVIEWLRGVCN